MRKKDREILAKKLLRKPEDRFEQVDLSIQPFVPAGMTRAYRNNRYTVMVYDKSPVTTGYATKILIQSHLDSVFPNHWAELQRIKNEIFGEETIAIEYYPSKSKVIDDHNIYWLWIFPEGDVPVPLFSI